MRSLSTRSGFMLGSSDRTDADPLSLRGGASKHSDDCSAIIYIYTIFDFIFESIGRGVAWHRAAR